ncbi:hypothetical protein [Ornithinibacillus halotolerans]|uniref:Uncharacterized protein n=1 Tax=Ornithinibacillus halotolerans TaxID=1274357 RepID=A0A916S186_9BACI|nr:hypothetical protein [Ornithinibacillus halotolerans]GGA79881.1 hypothetical protein GCM10008025_24130 [Ornithinibacillus halotolerans]
MIEFIGIIAIVFVLLGIEGQLKKGNKQNEELIELLKEMKE